MDTTVALILIGLVVVLSVHVAFASRSNEKRIEDLEREVDKLRTARHKLDGLIQQHAGAIRELSKHQHLAVQEDE